MKKRILIVRSYGGYGGIERQIENIAFGMISRDWEVFFLTDVESPLSKSLAQRGIHVTIAPFDNMLCVAQCICGLCEENQISIIQSHMLRESFYCRIAKLLTPSLVHIFRIHTYIDCSHISETKKKCYHLASRMTDCLVNRYIPINECNAQELRQRTHISEKKISVVHDAVRDLRPSKKTDSYKNGNIAMIANFVDFKGHDVLLEGLKLLKEQGHRFTVYLVGSVPGFGTANEDRRRLDIVNQTICDYGIEDQVVMVGYSSDIAAAVADCGMVVLPSDSEGTPNVLLEGMLLDKIVVTSAVGGVPEFVAEGETGFLHPPKDARAFADALLRAYNTPDPVLVRIADRAKGLVRKEYSTESLVDQLLSIYSSYMHERGKRDG